ncbi:hypothetical protein RI845_12780 [Thalassotalea nanhaiensis]|uniref:Uncharacterized protein n=1 Tax=Thalassotalea nanhaiensis TaxID=3065648 RepID=A0ABY9TF70_9GAMM|nr:hypothetical protein RI845_12780 [Colwelliaceae bacterium SQ345]
MKVIIVAIIVCTLAIVTQVNSQMYRSGIDALADIYRPGVTLNADIYLPNIEQTIIA